MNDCKPRSSLVKYTKNKGSLTSLGEFLLGLQTFVTKLKQITHKKDFALNYVINTV